MLAALDKHPKSIDEIIKELTDIFTGVEFKTLKHDAIEFYLFLTEEGYLSTGETYQECLHSERPKLSERQSNSITIQTKDCSKEVFGKSDFLRSLHIEVASACNERCVHCYIPHAYKNAVIDSSLFYSILKQARDLNVVNVTLSGGEPLLHPDIINFLARCRELDLSVNVLSNLTLLTDEILAEMKKNPLLCIQTSLYSMEPRVHDSITHLVGSFEKTKNNLLRLQGENIPLQISCPVMKQNKDSFIDVMQWGQRHAISVTVDPVIFATYDRTCSNLKERLSLEEIGAVIDKQLSETYVHAMREMAQEKIGQTNEAPICSICRYNFCISATGYAFPCVGWQSNIIGDLNRQTLREIWETSEKVQTLRQIKRKQFPRCVTCEDRGYCTVCMMSNANESPDGDIFCIDSFHCRVAAMTHQRIDTFRDTDGTTDSM